MKPFGQKNATPAKAFLRKVASIFMPLIPGFVGCGFFDGPFGHREILRPRSSCPGAPAHSASSGKRHLPVHEYPRRLERGQGLWRFARYWRHLGSPHFPSRPCRPHPLRHALDARPGRRLCRPPRYLLAAYGEKQLRKIVPPAFDLFVTPTLVILVMSLLALYVLQPVGGFLAETIGRAPRKRWSGAAP